MSGRSELAIAASPEIVWGILTDIERWPDWNPDVKSASLEGDLVVGTRFRWKAGPGTIASTLQELERPWKVAWIGRTLGIDAVDVFELEAQNDHTIVRQSAIRARSAQG